MVDKRTKIGRVKKNLLKGFYRWEELSVIFIAFIAITHFGF